MKVIVCVCLFVAVALARPSEDEKYPTKYDDINIEEILENERLLEPYIECILEKGKARCTAEGKELKSHIKEALENHCDKCNDKQKEAVRKVIKFLINNKDAVWQELVTKYDPEHKYSKKYEDDLKELKA